MKNTILTLNAGSSSVKFALFDADADLALELKGQVNGIGTDARLKIKRADGTVAVEHDLKEAETRTPSDALARILSEVDALAPDAEIQAVGHRIVHGVCI